MSLDPAHGEKDQQSLISKLDVQQRLAEISLKLNATYRLDALLDYIMDAAIEITNAEAASILLVDKNVNDLRFAAATGESGKKLIGTRVPIDGSIAGSIIEQGQAMIIDDAATDPRHYTGVDKKIEFQTRSILGVPMRTQDQLVGVLEVINKKQGHFTGDDLSYISVLAAQAGVAVHTAQLVHSLEEAYEDLNRLNELKSNFIAIASHELRTPLSVILGYATFLQEDAKGEVSEHARQVLDSALQMRTLIEGMTNLHYVQLKESDLSRTLHDMRDILREAYNDILPLAEAKDQIFEFSLTDEPLEVEVDRSKISLALTNVLNNAVKFTPPGGAILLGAELHPREVWVVIRDSGIGFSEGEGEKIFEAFYQIEDPLTRVHGGLGLGLTIARAIVERHGGRLWASSPGSGEGSRFTMAVPRAGVTADLDNRQPIHTSLLDL